MSKQTSCKNQCLLPGALQRFAQNCDDENILSFAAEKSDQRRFNECMKPLLMNTSIQIDVKATRLIAAMSKIAGLWGGFNELSVDWDCPAPSQ